MIKLSLLEFGLRKNKGNSAEILQEVIKYAVEADELGFSRMWYTEHHNLSPAWNTPEMLLPIISGLTSNIKIGIAGILLAMNSPYRVALNFKLLNTLFPGRIDLGLSNGQTHYEIAKLSLSNDRLEESYPRTFYDKLGLLVTLLNGKPQTVNENIVITPQNSLSPDIWCLGSSANSLPYVTKMNINFSLSIFHKGTALFSYAEDIKIFRENYFEKNERLPEINVAFSGICDKSAAKAKKRYTDLGFKEGQYPFNCIIGTPSLFFDTLSKYKEELGIDEYVFNDLSLDNKDRLKALQLLKDQFSL
ncbi:MAG: LLM class flavin-dependent oxidoreductase [Chitinophagaceae bacterium]